MANFTALIDPEVIKNILIGKPKRAFNEALSSIPGIQKGEAVIRPVWKSSFPSTSKKIKVIVSLD